MARPEKNTVEYFPFMCDDGKKMFYLEENYGNDGFATFLKILRELAKTNYHYLDLSKKTTLMFLSAKCKVSVKTLESIITDLVDLEKFDSVLWNDNKVIWCQDFVDSIQDAYSKRKNKCMTYEGLLLHLCSLGVRKPNKQQTKVHVNTQTILEETKLEKTIDIKKGDITEQLFLKRWKDARLYYDKKPTNITKFIPHERVNFEDLKKDYNLDQFEQAMQGMFQQKTFPKTRLRPTHFLCRENFETYLTCYSTNEVLFPDNKFKKPIERI